MTPSAFPKPPTPPALLVNGSPAPVNGSPAPVTTELAKEYYIYTGSGIVPISDTIDDLGKLLRAYCIAEGVNGRFWTNILLRHILTKQRIRNELKKQMSKLSDSQVDEYVEKIYASPEGSPSKAYIKVFALLALLNRVRDIELFIEEEVNDLVLPIELKLGFVYPLNNPKKRLRCFDHWEAYQQEHFESTQWEVDTPYLESTKDQALTEFTLQPLAHRPWRKVSNTSDETLAGAYATVVEVDIHPTAHSYQHLLNGVGVESPDDTLWANRNIKDQSRLCDLCSQNTPSGHGAIIQEGVGNLEAIQRTEPPSPNHCPERFQTGGQIELHLSLCTF